MGKTQKDALGPDNNKRLAEIEARAATLAEFFAAPIEGLEPIEGEDSFGLAMRAWSHAEGSRAKLAAGVAELHRFIVQRQGFEAQAGEAVTAAAIRELIRSDAEIGRLANSLRGYKAAGTKARNEVQVLKAAKSPEARPIGAMPAPADDAARVRRGARLEDALRAGPTQLVFSDGKREIRELEPLIVDGGAWRRSARGETLAFEPLLEPGDMAKPEVAIAGFALLDESGEQVGWCGLPEPIRVPRNGRVLVPANSIRF
jgi:hypothetical protein